MTLNVNPLQPFMVTGQGLLDRSDISHLTTLYQPIMGGQGTSLYLTLLSFQEIQDNGPLRHQHILQALNIGIKDFNQLRRKLEALGLMKTYRDNQSHPEARHQAIHYLMIRPLSRVDFLQNKLLNTALYNQLGEQDYQLLIAEEEKTHFNPEHFIEETELFSQAFYPIDIARTESEIFIPEKSSPPKVAYRGNFNYSQCLSQLMAAGIDHTLLNKELKDQIYAFHQIYHYNEEDIVQIIVASLNTHKNQVDYALLNKLAVQKQGLEMSENPTSNRDFKSKEPSKATYEFPFVYTATQLLERKQFLSNKYPELSPEDIELITTCEQIPHVTFLKKIKHAKKGFVTNNELKYLAEISQMSHLKPMVINFLIYYLLLIMDRPALYNGDLQRFANEWQQANIDSVPAVIQYLRQKDAKKSSYPSQKYKRKSTYVEPIPSWMEDSKDDKKTNQGHTNSQTDRQDNWDEKKEKALRDRLDALMREEDSFDERN